MPFPKVISSEKAQQENAEAIRELARRRQETFVQVLETKKLEFPTEQVTGPTEVLHARFTAHANHGLRQVLATAGAAVAREKS